MHLFVKWDGRGRGDDPSSPSVLQTPWRKWQPHTNIPSPIPPATSVHELLECPICTNSMYPPIHQMSEATSSNANKGVPEEAPTRLLYEQDTHISSAIRCGLFEWQPYKKLGKPFLRSVPKADRELFMSSAPLIFYWLLERHNTERVMKKFSLQQIVPPPFVLPFSWVERKQRVIVDYSKKYKMEMNMWEDRWRYITRENWSSSVPQSDEYMAWYSLNTIMLVGRIRGDEGQRPIKKEHIVELEPSIPQKRVMDFIDHIERSCDRALRNQGTNLGKFISSLKGKLKRFITAFGTTFDEYVESCNSSQSEVDTELVITPKKVYVKRPTLKSPVKKKMKEKTGPTEASPTKLSIPVDSESKVKPKVPIQKESPLKPTYQTGESSVHGYLESLNSQLVDNPNLVPVEEILSTSPCPDVFSTPTPIVPLTVVAAPSPATIESLVWRLKHLPRNRRVPERLLDFEHGVFQSEYVLSDLDKEIVEGFHKYYTTRKDELGLICSLIDCDTLNALLEPDTLLDTNVIYYYFEYLRRACGDVYLADPSLCSFWQKKHKAGDDCAFGVNGARVWDAKECKTLVYILHQHNHFTLLVG